DRAQLDQIVGDLKYLEQDEEYQKKGRSNVRVVGSMLGVQYAKLPGEAWALGAGYVVARLPNRVQSPLGFFENADDKDKEQANVMLAVVVALLGALVGLGFTFLEHTRPLHVFRREAHRLAKSEVDQMQPSKFRGVYRKIASDLNDGIDAVAAKGGVPRRAADLKQVLGDIPDEPQMSAFSFPGEQPDSGPAASAPAVTPKSLPKPPRKGLPVPPGPASGPRQESAHSGEFDAVASGNGAGNGAAEPHMGVDQEEAERRQVFDDFVRTMKE